MADLLSEMAGVLLTFVPLLVVMLLANLAEQRREQGRPHEAAAGLAYALTYITFFGWLIFGVAVQAVSIVRKMNPAFFDQLDLTQMGANSFPIDSWFLLGFGVWLPALLGILLLLPSIRKQIARLLPIDPASPVHAIALSWTMLVVINMTFTLGIGLGNLAESLQADEAGGGIGASTMALVWAQQLLTALLAIVGVGWLTRRTWTSAMVRLGIVRPTGRQVLIGLGWGLAMVPMILMLEAMATLLGLGIDADVEALTEELLGPLFSSPLGIITLGVAAAIGEETLLRGAVQPRFGLVLTALVFALLHSNYGITISTLFVLLLGFVLGYLRNRHNTSTAMITHAVYNMTLGLIAWLGASMLDL